MFIILLLVGVQTTNYGKPISILNSSQFHYVPGEFFLQFSLTSAELGYP